MAAARFFLFGVRDVWFVVALPVILSALGWKYTQSGGFLALWIIGYGIIQIYAPKLFKRRIPDGRNTLVWLIILVLVPAGLSISLLLGVDPEKAVIVGLGVFGVVFAVYSDADKVALNVGFYYMSNAGGRLLGTVLSGWIYQSAGFTGCLWWSACLLSVAAVCSIRLPTLEQWRQSALT